MTIDSLHPNHTLVLTYNPIKSVLKVESRQHQDDLLPFQFIADRALELSADKSSLKIDISIKSINTIIVKSLFDLFKKVRAKKNVGHNIEVNWHYAKNDEELLKTGEDYSLLSELPFEFVERA